MDLIFWTVLTVSLYLNFKMLELSGEKLTVVSPVTVLVVSLYLFSVVGLIPLYYQLDAYRVAIGVTDRETILKVLIFSIINISTLLVGVLVFKKYLSKKLSFDNKPCQELKKLTNPQEYSVYLLFLVSLAILGMYLFRVGKIAIFSLITDGASAAQQARSDMSYGFDGKYHWYKLFMRDAAFLVTFVSFSLFQLEKKFSKGFFFTVSLACSVFSSVMATEKAPIVWLIVGLIFVYILQKKNGIVRLRLIIPWMIMLFCILVVSDRLFMGTKKNSSAVFGIMSRAFSGSITPAYFYLKYYPELEGYLLGKTFPNPGGILPFEPVNFTENIMNWRFPEASIKTKGSMPTVFWGEAYVNFGPISIPIIAFLVGLFVTFISQYINWMTWNSLSIGFSAWFFLLVKDLSVSGFSSFIINPSLFFLVLFIYFTNNHSRLRQKLTK